MSEFEAGPDLRIMGIGLTWELMMKVKRLGGIYGISLLLLPLILAPVTLPLEAKVLPLSDQSRAGARPHHKPKRHDSHHRHSRHRDFWRWGIGLSLAYPYWPYYRPYNYRPYWDNNYYDSGYFPYGYRRSEWVVRPPVATSAPIAEPRVLVSEPPQITTKVQMSQAIKSLPANARVIQREGQTLYEWQGVEYRYDWQSQSYKALTQAASPRTE